MKLQINSINQKIKIMCSDYEKMRAEIRRLREVARLKDSVLNDCINTCNVLLKIAKPNIKDKRMIKFYEGSIHDFKASIG